MLMGVRFAVTLRAVAQTKNPGQCSIGRGDVRAERLNDYFNTRNSTRRLAARPLSVLLSAIGLSCP
jgi:hypothetical protein